MSADEQLWRAATGKNADYYVEHFSQFREKGGIVATWHWPAFLLGALWFVYRRMYAWALVALVLVALLPAIAQVAIGGSELAGALATLVVAIAFGTWANAIYFRSVNRKIDGVKSAQPDVRSQVDSLHSTSATNSILVIGAVLVLFLGGVFAAIAIPAYRDYTIRSQVTEGLGLASGIRAAVVEFRAVNQRWPQDNTELEWGPTRGKYTASVEVDGDVVVIEFGGAADAALLGKRLAVLATEDEQGNVSWSCGYRVSGVPDGEDRAAQLTTVAQEYLPESCR